MFLLIALFQSCDTSYRSEKNSIEEINKQVNQSTHNLQNITDDSVISEETIDKTADNNLEALIAENIYINFKVNENSTTEDYRKEYQKFSTEQKLVYATIMLERNVEAVGFEGYFTAYNSVGQFADYAIKGYKELNLTSLLEITSQALDIFKSKQQDMQARLQELTLDFNRELNGYNPSQVRIEYIRKSKEKFIAK